MIAIYYDGDCPFCARYVQMLRLQRTTKVELIDLRTAPDKVEEFNRAGYNLDEGMVVQAEGRDLHGANAVSYLAALSTPSDLLNRLNKAALSNPLAAAILYPLLRAGRWLALFLMDRAMLGAKEDAAHARREIFTTLFALYSAFHSFYHGLVYGRPSWDLILLFVISAIALLRPDRTAALFVLALTGADSGIIQMPTQSNHAFLALLTSLAYLVSVAIAAARNDAPARVFERFAPAGCGLLLMMYFFGIFHKINADFLNPVTSCAMTLWREMPAPLASLGGPFIEYSAIYGTFLLEGLIAIGLVIRKTRHIAVAAGMAFHLLLSLSNYAMYIAFSTLTVALHSLFLNEVAARAILDSPLLRAFRRKAREPIYWLLIVSALGLIATLALVGHYSEASLAAFFLLLPLCYAILRYGAKAGPYPRRGMALAGIFAAFYFANCMMPYMGLKTAQAGNMFANLRLEAGVSNHLVFSADRRPFGYLDDIAFIDGQELGLPYYGVLDMADRHPEMTFDFTMNGLSYRNQSAATLREDIEATLHPAWFRKWFNFQPVSLETPEKCNN
jgi:predicted DCC family thiol-disulfide oxidoreductase YuxK